jgi:hypothetical protein
MTGIDFRIMSIDQLWALHEAITSISLGANRSLGCGLCRRSASDGAP